MKKWFFSLAAFFAALILFLTVWPQLFHEQIEDLARKEINKRLQADVTFSHLTISLWKNFPALTVSLEQFNINTRGAAKESVFKADDISIAINFFEYVKDGDIDITGIFLSKPVLHAHVEFDGRTNFSILKTDTAAMDSDSASAIGIGLHLKKFIIENADINYTDEVSGNTLNLEEFNFEGNGDFSSSLFDLSTQLSSQRASLTWNGRTFFNDKKFNLDFLLAVDRAKNAFEIKKSNVQINSFSFLLTGGMALRPDRYKMDLKFSSPETTLAELLSLANFFQRDLKNIHSDGSVSFGGFVKGNYIPGTDSIPTFSAKLEVTEGTLKVDSVKDSINDIHFHLVVSNDVGYADSTEIEMDSVFFRINDHAIQGHAHLRRLANSSIDARLKGTIHTDELLAAYPVRGLKAAGELEFDIEVAGNYSSMKWPAEIPHVDFHIDITKGMLKYDSLPDSLSNISVHLLGHIPQGNWQQSKIEMQQLELNIGDNPVKGKLTIEGFAKPKVQGQLTAAIHLEDILKVFPLKGTEMKGTLNTSIDINGVYDSATGKFPTVEATLAVDNGFYKTSAYPQPLENIQIKASLVSKAGKLESTELNIQQLNYTLENEPFELNGVIRDFKSFAYDITAKGAINLDKVTKIFPLQDYTLSGKILSDVKVSGSLADLEANRYDKTQANGSIKMENINITGKTLPQPIRIATAEFRLTPEVIQLTSMKVQTGHSSFTLSGELRDYFCFITQDSDKVVAKLRLDADTLDLNEWKAAFSVSDQKTPSLSATAVSAPSAWQVPSVMDLDFDSNIRFVRYEDMTLADMEGEILMKDGMMSMRESGFNTLNARFEVSGTYDSRDILHPLFDFKLKIAELDIQKAYKGIKLVRDLLPSAATAEGFFSIDYSLKGELEQTMYPKTASLAGGGDVHIANAKINGMKMFEQLSKAASKDEMNNPHLRDFTMTSEIRDNKIFVKPFKLKVSGFNTEIEGVNTISGVIDYLIKVQLLPLVKLPFHVSGTYDNPKVALGKARDTEGIN